MDMCAIKVFYQIKSNVTFETVAGRIPLRGKDWKKRHTREIMRKHWESGESTTC
jgi:hypothetical protein